MNPIFFGSSSERLFGVFHPTVDDGGSAEGVIICYPVAHEYGSAHRAMRQLAITLSRASKPVMRFDYFGTGDSMGDERDMNLRRAEHDLETAIDELKDTAEVRRVSLVGLRVGGSLAMLVGSRREDVSKVVLWDPILDGSAFLEELRMYRVDAVRAPTPLPSEVIDGGMSATLLDHLRDLNLAQSSDTVPKEMLLVTSTSSLDSYKSFTQGCEQRGAKISSRCIPSRPVWRADDINSNELVPMQTIEAISSWLSN